MSTVRSNNGIWETLPEIPLHESSWFASPVVVLVCGLLPQMPADLQDVISVTLPHPLPLTCTSTTLLCQAMFPPQGLLDDPCVDVCEAPEVFCMPLIWRSIPLHSIHGASHLEAERLGL